MCRALNSIGKRLLLMVALLPSGNSWHTLQFLYLLDFKIKTKQTMKKKSNFELKQKASGFSSYMQKAQTSHLAYNKKKLNKLKISDWYSSSASRKEHLKSAYLGQKLLEPYSGRNTQVVILMKCQMLREQPWGLHSWSPHTVGFIGRDATWFSR